MFKGLTVPSVKRAVHFSPLSAKASGAAQGRRACIVSNRVMSPATTEHLAYQMQADGWRITLLDSSEPNIPDQPIEGVEYQRLAGLYRQTNWYIQMQSLTAYHWLRTQSFDLIIFCDECAVGFYSCSARRGNLALIQTPIIMATSQLHARRLEQAMQFPTGRHDFEIDFMERETVKRADALLVLESETGLWLQESGWTLPASIACLATDQPLVMESLGSWLLNLIQTPVLSAQPSDKSIFISVCMAVYNRPDWLRGALRSLQQQTYAHFEVIVVDDGSTNPAMRNLQNEFEPLFNERRWRWIRQDNTGPASARNHAAKIARGDHLLFMDDDNIAYPDELERFALAARQGYDILACIIGMHSESEFAFPPTAHLPERAGSATRPVGWTPIGGNLLLAVYVNVLGETNSLFRRNVFEKLGGFSTHKSAVLEDFELLTRAIIAGYRIDIIPEVLMLYRRTRQSRSMTQNIFEGHLNSLKPIADLMPESLRPLLLAIRNEWYLRHNGRRSQE